MAQECKAVVGEAVSTVASQYVQRRGAERALEALIDSVLRSVTHGALPTPCTFPAVHC